MFHSIHSFTPVAPEVYVAINKSRIKKYDTNNQATYYLGDKTEFQLELFNPTRETVLAKITIDGKNVSQGGLIIKPGVRIFLDRPLDVAQKFRFDTYEVENTKQALNAIADNGGIEVKFYRESQVRLPILINGRTGSYNIGLFNTGVTSGGYVGHSNSTITLGKQDVTSGNLRVTTDGVNSVTSSIAHGMVNNSLSYTNTSNSPLRGSTTSYTTQGLNDDFLGSSATMDSYVNSNQPLKKSRSASKSIETGRVGAGSTSNQEFVGVNMNFESMASYQTSFKILPLSQKVNEVGETLVKRYCTSCGTKQKPDFKFCPSCSNKN